MRAEQLFGKDFCYIWSDNWCMEDDKAWFMAGEMDILFSVDLNTRQTILENEILSDKDYSAREHPRCIKKGDVVVCLPCNGRNIWCYHLCNRSWTNIVLKLPKGVRSACFNAWFIGNKLYVISFGLKQIIEIDMDREKIINYYDLFIGEKEHPSRSILVDNCIYFFSSCTSSIYKFDCLKKNLDIYTVSNINDQIQTICFDGDKFWLSGEHKKFYIWDEKTKQVIFLEGFPKEFGIWNFSGKCEKILTYKEILGTPLFIDAIAVEQHIWFIPFRSNDIIYVDKDTLKIKKFHISEEEQTEENIKTQLLGHKYLVEYVRRDRFIGLFSLKNTWIFEIDCKELSYKIIDFEIGKNIKKELEMRIFEKALRFNGLLSEHEQQDLLYLTNVRLYGNNILENKKEKIGERIYSRVKG